MPDRRIPSDLELRDAVQAIRLTWLRLKFVTDRLLWAATSSVLDADTNHIVIRDALAERGGS